jgi:hypothetical protein
MAVALRRLFVMRLERSDDGAWYHDLSGANHPLLGSFQTLIHVWEAQLNTALDAK